MPIQFRAVNRRILYPCSTRPARLCLQSSPLDGIVLPRHPPGKQKMVCKLIQQAFLLAFILLVLASPTDLSSCGPFFPEAVFNLAGGPDDEQAFYKGHLGILQPEYERRYLVVAYRILSGQPLNASQIHSVSDFFHYRSKDVDAALASWRNARALVRGTAQIEIQPYRESG